MSSKIIIIMLLIFSAFYAYSQEATSIGKAMIDNLNVSNAKCITIPSQTDVLRIYLERNKLNSITAERVEINHHERKSVFHTSTNFAITQDETLVFARKGDKVYAKAFANKDEDLSIKFNNLKYIFEKNMIKIHGSRIHEEFYAEEVIFNTADNSFILYNKGKLIKKISTSSI